MAATSKVIEVKPVKIETIRVTIEGDTPLICNKFSNTARKAMLEKQMGIKSQRAPKDPEQNFQESIYVAEDGWYGFPASGIKKACVGACRFVDGLNMTTMRGAFFVKYQGYDRDTAQQLVMLQGEPEILESMVRLMGKTADIRFRSQFDPWSIAFDVRYNPHVITAEAIVNLIQLAGFHQGIGDWRPEKNGESGMFHVKID